jgi:hypothetical protein
LSPGSSPGPPKGTNEAARLSADREDRLASSQQHLYGYHAANFRAVAAGFDEICALLKSTLGDESRADRAEALTRIATFLLSAKIEARFYKLLHEPPVPEEFRALINAPPPRDPSLIEKWRRTVEIAFREYHDVTGDFQRSGAPAAAKRQHASHMAGIDHLESIIQMRNKVAHGQWRFALNNPGTALNQRSTDALAAENLMSLQLKDRLAASIANAVNDLVVSRKAHDRDLAAHQTETDHAIRELRTRSYETYLSNLRKRAAVRRRLGRQARARLKGGVV